MYFSSNFCLVPCSLIHTHPVPPRKEPAMRKSLLGVVAIAIALIVTLTGCGSANSSSSNQTSNLEGSWHTVDGESTLAMTATIQNNEIEVLLVTEDVKGLYWAGDFPSASSVTDGSTVTSKADTEALSGSILGSGSDTKEFRYDNETLSFDFTVSGATSTIELHR